jgi:mono/diheme cytochrome c family protein
MAEGRDLLSREEERSYGAVFLVSVALLLACTVWAIWQDSFSRHLWKKLKADFYRLALATYSEEVEKERTRLAADPEYTALTNELSTVRQTLDGAGEEGRRLTALQKTLADAEISVGEADLDLRIVKGEIEEAWYLLEYATHAGGSGDEERARLHALEAEKEALQQRYDATVASRDDVVRNIGEIRRRETEILEKLRPYEKGVDALRLKLDGVSFSVFGHRAPRIPTIEQVVLKSYERNNFDQWVDRVERCMNCHVAIDRPGFEDLENPLKTHPMREYYLGQHETKGFGCTPCHGGQGASINSVEQAHGQVPFWEEPLLDVHDRVQANCLKCHHSTQGMDGAQVVTRGESLFREMGCHGCHLVRGYDQLPKIGPSLKRIAAKTTPEWLVSWIEKPQQFRPRTKMPHFFLSQEESEAIAAYLLAVSVDESSNWVNSHPQTRFVDEGSRERVEKGRHLTQTVGCLGCHGFTGEQFASETAVGKDTAPNLARIAEKTDGRWLFHWLQDPRGYNESARMPRLRLSDEEAGAIASYLLTLKTQEPPRPDPALRKKLAERGLADTGARLVRQYGCFGCHEIEGMEKESRVSVELSDFANKHLEELFFGDRLDIPNTWEDWTINKILTPRMYETERITQNMPDFGFDRSDARALTVFLASRSTKPIQATYLPHREREDRLKRGREVVSHYNCYGCHTFDGMNGAIRKYYENDPEAAPPILVGEGKKVQPEWFFDFLKKPIKLRPWLEVRMPTFGMSDAEVAAIVEYFSALDGYELGPVVVESRQEAHAAAPEHEAGLEEPVDCFACHPHGTGRVPLSQYAVSRRALLPSDVRHWLNESAEPDGEQAGAEEARLRELLGVQAN